VVSATNATSREQDFMGLAQAPRPSRVRNEENPRTLIRTMGNNDILLIRMPSFTASICAPTSAGQRRHRRANYDKREWCMSVTYSSN